MPGPVRRRLRRRLAASGVLGVLMVGMVPIASPLSAGAANGWSIVPSPDSGSGLNQLDGVSCHPAPDLCQAVGFYLDKELGTNQTLVESWNGTTWSIVPSPNVVTGDNDFLGVSCGAARSCQAVGHTSTPA